MLSMTGVPGANAGGCDEDSGEVRKVDLPLVRREFLKGSGVLMGSLAGSSLLALAPSSVWAAELKNLSAAEGKVIMAMGRTLFPHKKLPDAVYALLAKDLDGNKDNTKLLKDGVAALNKAAGGDFTKATDAKKLEIVKGMEKTPFFSTVRGQCITSLYDNDMAYAAFGYPGASWDKGGYISRGFQDLKWLPEPDKDASPAPWMG